MCRRPRHDHQNCQSSSYLLNVYYGYHLCSAVPLTWPVKKHDTLILSGGGGCLCTCDQIQVWRHRGKGGFGCTNGVYFNTLWDGYTIRVDFHQPKSLTMERTHSFNIHIQHLYVHIELEQNPGQAVDQPQHSLEVKNRPWKWEVYGAARFSPIFRIFEQKA